MAKHMVTCVECGRRFDADFGAYYDKYSRRYTCRRCYKKEQAAMKERAVNNRRQQTGMRQSTGAMIAKIAFGALFVFAGFSSPEGGWSVGYFLTSLVIGGALIAWGLLPYLTAKKQAQIASVREEELLLEKENEPKVCSSCGATSRGKFCEYCGSKLI